MARIIGDPATKNDLNPVVPPGTIGDGIDAYGHHAKFRYVQFVDAATAYADGHICVAANAAGTAVTNDFAGGSAITGKHVFGICRGAMTVNYYGWVQVTGRAAVLTDGGVAAGDYLVAHAITNGACDTMAAGGEHQVFGRALADDATNDGIAWLNGIPA